jgi:hypothetical protein
MRRARITEAAKTWGSGAYALVIRQVEGSP